MKKILILGAMPMHIPIIKRARERGFYVLTCDYIPENEGHKFADEPHFDSTTDLEAVLKVATDAKINGILTFNSDPAALTAAWVAEKIGLPSSGLEAVRIMSEKDQFRRFLLDHNFNVPFFKTYSSFAEVTRDSSKFNFPLIVKPVDSSGSKGVNKVDDITKLQNAFNQALELSRNKRVIIEEYIEPQGHQLHGDGFVIDNEVVFTYLGDHHYNAELNGLVPFSTTFPTAHSDDVVTEVEQEVKRFIRLVGFKQGGINIEARVSKRNGKIYLIEVGPRNGGNFTPIVIQYASKFNFIDSTLDVFTGEDKYINKFDYKKDGYFAYLILHSDKEGILKSISINDSLNDYILERHIYLKPGDKVRSFRGANAAVGVLIVKFPNREVMDSIVNNFKNYYTINLDHE